MLFLEEIWLLLQHEQTKVNLLTLLFLFPLNTSCGFHLANWTLSHLYKSISYLLYIVSEYSFHKSEVFKSLLVSWLPSEH